MFPGALRQHVLTDGGSVDGWSGKDLVLFSLFFKNYSIYHANNFWSTYETFQYIVGEKVEKKFNF